MAVAKERMAHCITPGTHSPPHTACASQYSSCITSALPATPAPAYAPHSLNSAHRSFTYLAQEGCTWGFVSLLRCIFSRDTSLYMGGWGTGWIGLSEVCLRVHNRMNHTY